MPNERYHTIIATKEIDDNLIFVQLLKNDQAEE